VEESKRPNPGLYGPLLAQIAATPVQQGPVRQAVGQLAPIAGAVVGGIYGGPAGAAAGGAAGGYIGQGVGGASYGPYAGRGPNGTLAGLASGVGMAGNFVTSNGQGGRNYFGVLGSGSVTPPNAGYDAYYAPYRNAQTNYGGSSGYGGGRYIT
jgi:hypothetical protein